MRKHDLFDGLPDVPFGMEEDVSEDERTIRIAQKREDYLGRKQDREQRKLFSALIFSFMCLYMASAMVAVFLCGFGLMKLSDAVVIALLTSTFADVISVFVLVAKYLFHSKE